MRGFLESRRVRAAAFGLYLASGAAGGASGREDRLAQEMRAILERKELYTAHVSACFVPLDGGRGIYALNSEKMMVPGSTTKLVTAGVALALLGADHRFRTPVYATGPIRDGELDGDLVLVASGDPNLSGRVRADGTLAFKNHDHAYANVFPAEVVEGDPLAVLAKLARDVAAKGIRRVKGAVRVDAALFAEGAHESGTGVAISPIALNDNVVDVFVTPGKTVGTPAQLRVAPDTPYARFVNEVGTVAGGPTQVDFQAAPQPDGSFVVTASGSAEVGKSDHLFAYNVERPSRFAELAFVQELHRAGVEALPAPASRPVAGGDYAKAQLVAEHVSAPFSEDVKVTLKVSQNLHAAMMPYVLGAVLGGDHGDSSGAGFDKMNQFLTREGLDLSEAAQADGEGAVAFFSAGFMARFLVMMSKQKDFVLFEVGLPVLGRDGTLVDTLRESPMAGKVRAKTGTHVLGNPLGSGFVVVGKGLAGYVTTASGRKVAFAVYINHVPTSRDMKEVMKVGDALAEMVEVVFRNR